MKIFCILLVLVFSVSISAQSTTLEATTKDGKKVILKSNKTWEYDTSQPSKTVTISIEAALTFKNGDVTPVARVPLYLLSASLEEVFLSDAMKQLYLTDAEKSGFGMETAKREVEEKKLRSLISNLQYEPLFPTYVAAAKKSLKDLIKYETVTDFQGKAVFKDIPPGKYFLFGYTNIRKNFIAWHLEINAAGETINLILDPNNAL